MTFFAFIVFGIIQGLTEFLPISSSGHLYLAQAYFGLSPDRNLEIGLHMASLFAVFCFFWQKIKALIGGFFGLIISKIYKKKVKNKVSEEMGILASKLLLATICTMPLAFLIKDFVQLSNQVVGLTLLVTAGLILVSEKFSRYQKNDFTWVLAVFLGLVQGASVLPGISRSGLTIAFLILMGIERKKSVEISFLLAIPTILGAGLFAFQDNGHHFFFNEIFFVSAVVCFVVSLLTIKFMMKKITRYWFWFAPYCLILGVFLIFGKF